MPHLKGETKPPLQAAIRPVDAVRASELTATTLVPGRDTNATIGLVWEVGMVFAQDPGSPLYPKEVPMPELPALPLWDVLYLNGISLVLTGVLAALLDDGPNPKRPWDELPPLADPYAEI